MGRRGSAARAHTEPDDKRAVPGATSLAKGSDATSVELDRLIHERVRLGIVSALAVNESLSFTELKGLMGATDGNLSVHARKLEEAGYVTCEKVFHDRVPNTTYSLTAAGRSALERYLGHMEAIIKVTRSGQGGRA